MRSLLNGLFPLNWEIRDISDLVFFQEGPGVRKSQFTNEGIKLLNGGNINDNKLNLETTSLYISSKEAYGKYNHFLVDDGDLLIACSGIAVANFSKKIAFVEKAHLPLCMNTSTMRFKALDKDILDLQFMYHYLQTHFFKDQLRKLITGSAQLNFGPSHIKRIKIPLPPLPEQKRIAAMLDKADALRQKNKQLLAAYDELLQAAFLEMFGDPVTNPKGWEKKKLSDVSSVVSGVTKGRKLKTSNLIMLPYIRVANVQDGFLVLDEIKTIKVLPSDLEKYRLVCGDILLTEGGDPDKLGRGAVWKSEIKNCIHQNHVYRVRILHESLCEDYLSSLFSSAYGKRYFLKSAKQTTGIASVNSTQLKRFPVIMAPLELQNKYKKAVENIEAQKALVKKSLQESEDLFGTLVQKAFSGSRE